MKISISQTSYQKHFLSIINDQSRNFFKNKFQNFNVSGELDHSLTNTVFNLINRELTSLTDLFPSLHNSFTKFEQERRNQRKIFHLESNFDRIHLVPQSMPRFFDYEFTKALKKVSTEYQFQVDKFSSSIAKLLVYMGIYEELYLVNSLVLSFDANYSLSYDQSIYTISTRTNSLTFKVFPIFFLVKFLFSASDLDYSKKIILEKLLSLDFQTPQILLTISDRDQINKFFEFCNMTYLSEFVIEKLCKGEGIQLPKVINISQLRF